MSSPAWVSIIISLIVGVFTIGGVWALMQYKVAQIERDTDKMAMVIEALKDTIREEFAKVSKRISTLLFEESGTSRYLPRSEFLRIQENCREDLVRRVERLEGRSHDHAAKDGTP
ncbi:MAG TPA: hypothetical protein DCZ95_12525 [Verrucomicrobia bacterium]|nr:hypothetical protein [Verrucomicrobiota bacterium]